MIRCGIALAIVSLGISGCIRGDSTLAREIGPCSALYKQISLDPSSDARTNWARGDRRFVATSSNGVGIPLLKGEQLDIVFESGRYRVIEGMSDDSRAECFEFSIDAYNYAEQFNREMLRLEKQNE